MVQEVLRHHKNLCVHWPGRAIGAIEDVEFSARHIVVRDGKGFKDRVTILPVAVVAELQDQLVRVKALHEDFLRRGFGDVELPYALIRKHPKRWQ